MESASGGKQHVGYSVTFQNSLVGQQCFLTAIGLQILVVFLREKKSTNIDSNHQIT